MEKDFDAWNEYKKKLDAKKERVDFHEREIWWGYVGINIGSEQNANPPDFIRPLFILKRWSPTTFWGIPLTTQLKNHSSRFRLNFNKIESDLLIDMLRVYDSKRLFHKIGLLPEETYSKIVERMHLVLPASKNEIPLQEAGNFEGQDLSI